MPGVRTFHLDDLAEQGMRFSDFHVANPVCSPSRTAFMTGQFPSTLGIFNYLRSNHAANHGDGMPDYLNTSVPTITRIMQQAGYRTGHFGKWHLGKMQCFTNSVQLSGKKTGSNLGACAANRLESCKETQYLDLTGMRCTMKLCPESQYDARQPGPGRIAHGAASAIPGSIFLATTVVVYCREMQ